MSSRKLIHRLSFPLFTFSYFAFTILLERIVWNWWIFIGALLMDGAIYVEARTNEHEREEAS